jgi:hypothetical protein
MPVFVAFVAFVAEVALVADVALVAVDALPVRAPTKVVDVTEVNPAMVVTVPPSDTAVDPMVTELFVNAAFGMAVSEAPEPAKVVADKTPVDGTKDSFVELTLIGLSPVFVPTHAGKTDVAVATSFVTALLSEFVALLAFVALPAVSDAAVPVRPVPAPVKEVAERTPVDGFNESLVELTFCGRLPVVAVTQVG